MSSRSQIQPSHHVVRACDACKIRHRKCDNALPSCASCVSFGFRCVYSNKPASALDRPERAVDPLVARLGSSGSEASATPSGSANLSRGFGNLSLAQRRNLESSITDTLSLPPNKSNQLRQLLYDQSLPGANNAPDQPQTTPVTDALQKALISKIEAARETLLQVSDSLPDLMEDTSPYSPNSSRHVEGLNPFNFYSMSEVETLIGCFQRRVNSVFFLFGKNELEGYLQTLSQTTSALSNQIMCGLCMALALGAQASDLEDSDKSIMWYENGRRYLDNEDWENELWIMRITTSLSLYHLDERRETAFHYLRIALTIGRANLLDEKANSSPAESGDNLKWLQVWRTVRFLDHWLTVTRYPNPRELLPGEPHAESQGLDGMMTPRGEDNLTSILVARLGSNLYRILQDVYVHNAPSLQRYEKHMKEMQIFVVQLPEQYQPSMFEQIHGMTDEQSTVMLHLHCLRLGSLLLLTRSLLLQTVTASLEQSSNIPELDFGIRELANVCIESASQLIFSCHSMFRAGAFPRRFWLPLYFLFEASMISVLAAIWHKPRETGASDNSVSCLQRAKSDLGKAMQLFQYCAPSNNAALHFRTVAQRFEQFIRDF